LLLRCATFFIENGLHAAIAKVSHVIHPWAQPPSPLVSRTAVDDDCDERSLKVPYNDGHGAIRNIELVDAQPPICSFSRFLDTVDSCTIKMSKFQFVLWEGGAATRAMAGHSER